MEPLEVFALTSDMQRATGSIPYTSLMWDRRYYEVGEFLMEIPGDIYDSSWAYIYTDERPETGIIESVEYKHVPHTSGTVILRGRFFERELNRYTFLVEETEDQAYRIYKPSPAKTVMPTMWTDNLGMTYVKTGSQWETIDGDYVDPATVNQSEMTQIDLQPGDGLTLIEYPTTNTDRFPSGKWNAGEYSNVNYSYYSEDGSTLVSVAPDGTETEYPIVRGGTGDVIYEAEDGFHWVNGVASDLESTYVRALDSWEDKVETEGLEVVRGDGTIFGGSTYARAYRTVKGPWQLRTDLDVNEPADNVQRIIQWAQDIWGNNLLYDEVGFEGESKIIDPSLKLFGDLAYEELKTVGASPRLFYSFESDTAVLQIWRGLDRTQSQAGVPETPDDGGDDEDEPTIDELYEELEYIVSTGTQWVDTGFKPNQDTRVVMDVQSTAAGTYSYFGARTGSLNTSFTAWQISQTQVRTDYGNNELAVNVDSTLDRAVIDMDGASFKFGDYSAASTAAAFQCAYTLYLLNVNNAGSPVSGRYTSGRLYSCRIYDNGTLARDFVPRRRVSDGAVGLLDLANDTFYESAGTEAFLAPGELPSGYTRLEYIESTGSQYIDTGIVANQDTRLVMDMVAVSFNSSANMHYGSTGANQSPAFMGGKASASSWKWVTYYGSTYLQDTSVVESGHYTRGTIDHNRSVATWHDVSHSFTATTFSTGYPMFLCGVNIAGTPTFLSCIKLYSCQIYDNGAIARDYIPAKNSSGEAGLFDLYTMAFYADASGTGFIAGPEVAAVAEVASEPTTYALARTTTDEDGNTAANPFAVFSDTWGTLYGFTASRDVSNYRNTCYVLYQFRDQTDADGNPIGPRGYVTARLEDEMPDAETVLDLRGEEPENDDQTDEAFIESLRQRGLAHLQSNYAIIENLETGTLVQDGYLTVFDLGDKVDMLVEAVGLVKEARITGACEVHEAGSSTVSLEIGEQKITNIRKAVIM